MNHLRLLLVASVAYLALAQEPETTSTAPETTPDPSSSDSPSSTADLDTFVGDVGPGVQLETSTGGDVSSTDETMTDSAGNATTTAESPSSGTRLGVWTATSVLLLAVAVMS